MRGHRDLILAVGAAAIAAGVTILVPFEALRTIAAIPLALFLPGYAISVAIFARRTLVWPMLMVLSVGFSLMTVVLGGLIVDYAPGGIRPLPWALLLLVVVIGGCRSAAVRRRAAGGGLAWPRISVSWAQAGLLIAGLAATVAALALSSITLPATSVHGYTELWISPRDNAAAAGVSVGVRNEQQRSVAYALRVRSRDRGLRGVRRFSLEPGESRTFGLIAARPQAGTPTRVTALLFRRDRPTVYRRVWAWVQMPSPR